MAKNGKYELRIHQKMSLDFYSSHFLRDGAYLYFHFLLLLLFGQLSNAYILQQDNIPSTVVYSLEKFALCASSVRIQVNSTVY